MSEMELKYKVYCLNYITQDIEDIIDTKSLTYQEFCVEYNKNKTITER